MFWFINAYIVRSSLLCMFCTKKDDCNDHLPAARWFFELFFVIVIEGTSFRIESDFFLVSSFGCLKKIYLVALGEMGGRLAHAAVVMTIELNFCVFMR